MFVVLLKSFIIFLVVFFVIRLMGKRQIGEMQPFELVITLIIAEVACIPMNDPYIPLYYGLIPIITLAMLHIVLSFISRKSVKVRKLLSGSSIVVIDKSGIVYENLQKMNMNMADLVEAVRTAGYVDFSQIAYAIFETNGQLCVVEKEQQQSGGEQSGQNGNSEQSQNSEQGNQNEQSEQQKPTLLPLELVVDGKINEKNLEIAGAQKSEITDILSEHDLKLKDLLYCDVRQDGNAYFSPKHAQAFCTKLAITGGENW